MKLRKEDIDLRQLEIFCCIVEHQSFSRAAQSLYISQPSVSEHIANLESVLKLRLLDRKSRKVVLTHAGKIFYADAAKMLTLKGQMLKKIDGFSNHTKGSLLVGASSIPGSYVLPPHITKFKSLYPDASVKLIVRDTKEVVQAVRDGHYEIGIVGGKPKYPEIQSGILCTDRLLMIIGANHPMVKRTTPLQPRMLAKMPFVLRGKGSAQRDTVEMAFSKFKLPLNIICEMDGNEAIKEAVKNGDGASFLSFRAVEKDVSDGLLKVLKVKGMRLERSFYIIFHKHRTLSPLSELFLTYLQSKSGERL